MKHHLNTLYVTVPGAYLRKDGQAVAVHVHDEIKLRVPLHNLGSLVTFGAVGVSPGLMAACAQTGVAISLLDRNGRFLARVAGFTAGNVLLRRTQYRRADDARSALDLARAFVAGKIANARSVLLRGAREYPNSARRGDLERAADQLDQSLSSISRTADLDALRGVEGDAASAYFNAFDGLIVAQQGDFRMTRRSRRPPLDNLNALLSFVYTLLTHDARAACEATGLDPAVGFLHADRPGRPSLALDLMEEFRPFIADRVTLSLINRRQVRPDGFQRDESGAVRMADDTRKTVVIEYQNRKQETIEHPFLGEKTTIGLLVHLQARLLARHLRGELDGYPPFIVK